MSKISDALTDAKEKLEEIRRDRRYKKERMNMEDIVELRSALVTCSRQLSICKNNFELAIWDQARNIRDGEAIGSDTTVQGQILENAAIGYLLVKDAIFQLKSVERSDTVTQAYNTLDAVIDLMTDRTRKLPSPGRIRRLKEREVFGGITSDQAVEQKRLIVSQIFDSLKQSGDIESCLEGASDPASVRAARMTAGGPPASPDIVKQTLYGEAAETDKPKPHINLDDYRN